MEEISRKDVKQKLNFWIKIQNVLVINLNSLEIQGT
jgi:hypothetical protein